MATFALTARWHARQHRMRTALRELSPEIHEACVWGAGLPPAWYPAGGGGLAVVPLTSSADLFDEGAVGPDASGFDGMAHCVGSWHYADRCLAGRIRIVSLRRVDDATGAVRRLSTAEIVLDDPRGFRAAQHHGRGNAPPDRPCDEALADYLRRLNSGELAVGRAALKPVEDARRRADPAFECGYVPTRANVEAAMQIGEPLLRRPARGLDLDGFLALPEMRALLDVILPPEAVE